MTAKKRELSQAQTFARDKGAWLLYRYADPRIRRTVDFRAMENGTAQAPLALERNRTDAGHELLDELAKRSPAIAELLVAACMAGDNLSATQRAREGCRALEDLAFPGEGIVLDAELEE